MHLRELFPTHGFIHDKEEEVLASCKPLSDVPALDTANLFMNLCNGGVKIPVSVTSKKFVGMDSADEPWAELTDDDIITKVC